MTLAVAKSATKRFGQVLAVDGVDLSVERGEVIGLLGANGAGKTTLIRMLLGLIPATAGSIELFGESPSRRTRRRIGYLPQGLGLYEDLTAAENLSFAAAAFGARASMPLDLRDVRDALVRELPLGVRRRVGFAAALQHSPELLVLDEPTSGVDVVGRASLWDTIRTAAEEGAGVIVTTHHMEEAAECDRLVLMASGRVVEEGSYDDIAGRHDTVLVRAPSWTKAFDALDSAGLAVALVGTTLRVRGGDRDLVSELLRSDGIDASVEIAASTLDEVFATIAAGDG